MTEKGYANFHLVFLLKLARFLGIAPNMEEYADGDSFDLANGTFGFSAVASDSVMSATDTRLLFLLSGANYETMDGIAMNRYDRVRLVRYLSAYYALHIANFPTLQSLDVLQNLFFEG